MAAGKSSGRTRPGKPAKPTIRILCVSDYHRDAAAAANVEKLAEREKVDVVLNAGDFLSQEFASKVLEKTKFRTFVVRGNWDGEIRIRNRKVSMLSCRVIDFKGYRFMGADYRHYCDLGELAKGFEPGRLILLTHDPPFDILDMSFFGSSAGSVELREFVEKMRPALHVFGHIHESAGVVKHRGTIFVNAALPEFRKAAIVELPSEKVRVFDV